MKLKRDHELVEYHEPTWLGVLLLLAAILLGVTLLWLGLSWALNHPGAGNVGIPQ